MDAEEARAKALIQSIRDAQQVDNPAGFDAFYSRNGRTLCKALDAVSKQLYSNPTHFVLELIQNADDNKYDEGTPCLTFAYDQQRSFLWVGCNEVGFSDKNVDAICDVGASSKNSSGSRKGYIGEKGIGFKSVFKVADEVLISSGPFSFRFQRDALLGMIAPEWYPFRAAEAVRGTTVFRLRIALEKDKEIVTKYLANIQCSMLLFLRKVKRIEVKLLGQGQSFSIAREDGDYRGLKRTTLTKKSGSGPDRFDFLVFEDLARQMPYHEAREGISESELLIALPVKYNSRDGRLEPILEPQMVYNFLPIRPYGLSFLVQADLILNAGREEICQEVQWNEMLLDGLIDLFVKCVHHLNRHDVLKFEWPEFLQARGSAFETAMDGFLERLRHRLRTQPVLYSQVGEYRSPSSLLILPESFRDGPSLSTPLLTPSDRLAEYVSPRYSVNGLRQLGVSKLNNDDLAALLHEFVGRYAREMKSKPSSWHERLAKAILSIGSWRVKDLALVPLRNGTWTSTAGMAIFFPSVEDGVPTDDVPVPEGINVNIVEPQAARNPQRRKLFEELGVQRLTTNRVCNLIIDTHASMAIDRPESGLKTLIDHVWYLFKYSHNQWHDLAKIKVATASQQYNSAPFRFLSPNQVFMDKPGSPFRLSAYVKTGSATCYFIHQDYLERAPEEDRENWIKWLQDRLGICTLPKLSAPSGALSKEFSHIIRTSKSRAWLHLLKSNWRYYERELNEHPDRERLESLLGEKLVDCTNGYTKRLDKTYLAIPSVTKERLSENILPLLDVEQPTDPGWQILSRLGVGTQVDLKLYVASLYELADRDANSVDKRHVLRLYKAINHNFRGNAQSVIKCFRARKVIRIQRHSEAEWVGFENCRWNTPPCLKSVIPLSRHFEADLEPFFVTALGMKDADASDIIKDISALGSTAEDFENAKDLLLALGDRKIRALKPEQVDMLKEQKMFPVRCGNRKMLATGESNDWFIADRERHRRRFEGKILLLDFSNDQLKKFQRLVTKLELSSHLLSSQIREKSETMGSENFQHGITQELQAKAKYISLLLDGEKRDVGFRQLLGIQVHSSTTLLLRASVQIGSNVVHGEDEVGRVAMEEKEASLNLYITEDSVTSGEIPWHFIREELARFYNLSADRQILLYSILTTSRLEEIEHILERDDVMSDSLIDAGTDPLAVQDALDNSDEEDLSSDDEMGDFGPRADSFETPTSTYPRIKPLIVKNSSPIPGGSSRRVAHGHRPKFQLINTEAIVTAATRSDLEQEIDVPGATNHSRTVSGATPLRDSNEVLLTTGAVSSPRRPARRSIASAAPSEDDGMNMSKLASALPVVNNSAPREKEIGFGGELFAFTFLQKFGISEDCWTSGLRSLSGREAFTGQEGNYSDFTISDSDASQQISEWLLCGGYDSTITPHENTITYHIEVKTTLGHLSEPFVLSNNQLDLARRWHASPNDVYIILRVYNLLQGPEYHVYVDPIALMQAGKLRFGARDGYSVYPA